MRPLRNFIIRCGEKVSPFSDFFAQCSKLQLYTFFLTGVFLFTLVFPHLSADQIHLTNGNTLQGKVVKRQKKWVVIRTEVPDGTIRIRKNRIKRIEKEGEEKYNLDQASKKRRVGFYRKALDDIRKVLDEHPDSNRARRELKKTYIAAGREAFKKKRLTEAETFVKEGLAQFPDQQKLLNLKSKVESYQTKVQKIRKRARTALERRNYPKAVELFTRVRKMHPDAAQSIAPKLAQAHQHVGIKQFRQKNYRNAISHFRDAVSFDPNRLNTNLKRFWVRAALERTGRFFDQKKFGRAASFLQEQIDVFPEVNRLTFFLGSSYQRQGKLQKAAEAFASVLDRRTPSGSIDIVKLRKQAAEASSIKLKSQKNTFDKVLPGEWRKRKTRHFLIYHRNRRVAKRAAKVAEHSLERIQNNFQIPDLQWNKRRSIYIYPSENVFRKHSDMPDWSTGVTQRKTDASGQGISRILTYQKAPQLFRGVLPHEIGHVVLHNVMPYRSIPQWFEEGVATQFEYAYKKGYYRMQVRSALSGNRLIPLEELIQKNTYPSSESQKKLFYAQSFVLLDFLRRKGGWRKLIEMGKQFAQKPAENVINESYGYDSIDELKIEWIEFVEKN